LSFYKIKKNKLRNPSRSWNRIVTRSQDFYRNTAQTVPAILEFAPPKTGGPLKIKSTGQNSNPCEAGPGFSSDFILISLLSQIGILGSRAQKKKSVQ